MTDFKDDFVYDGEVYKTLLESTNAIPWKIDWATLQFTYIGPQIEKLLGWQRDSWVSVYDWAERMHPDDRAWVVDFCVAQSQSGTDHEADYRALNKQGEYVWIRDVVHIIRNEHGEVEALVGFMFDISERKQTEQKLLDLQKELEELSYKDGLTGIANRRMFDNAMDLEWSTALRMNQPLSLLIIDIDYFKQYNDHYGHVQGDDCLKAVAIALSEVPARSRDFVARFGGEEFVILLPDTELAAARKVAERCQRALLKLQISHQKSAVSQLLTISIGAGTIIPKHGEEPADFIKDVDAQLYLAKQEGRNQVQSSAR